MVELAGLRNLEREVRRVVRWAAEECPRHGCARNSKGWG